MRKIEKTVHLGVVKCCVIDINFHPQKIYACRLRVAYAGTAINWIGVYELLQRFTKDGTRWYFAGFDVGGDYKSQYEASSRIGKYADIYEFDSRKEFLLWSIENATEPSKIEDRAIIPVLPSLDDMLAILNQAIINRTK